MQYLENLLSQLLSLAAENTFLTTFIGVFFLGETALISILTITQIAQLNLLHIVIAATIATLSADVFWIAIGRYFPKRWIPGPFKRKLFAPVNKVLKKIINQNIFITLLVLKFLIGIRLPILLHLASYKISWGRIVIYDLVGIVIYIFILAIIGTQIESLMGTTFDSEVILINIALGILAIVALSKSILYLVTRHKK